MQTIHISTLFDITKTNVLRKYEKRLLPYKTSHSTYNTKSEWITARQQQSNWETMLQVISLRAQPVNISAPTNQIESAKRFGYALAKRKVWSFSFQIESSDVFLLDNDPIGLLKQDCVNVILITGLTEDSKGIELVTENHTNMVFRYEI